MKKIFIIDVILLSIVMLIFIKKISYLTIYVALLYMLILSIYIYINMILKNTSTIRLKNRGNYWTYLGLPFILLGKTYFVSTILINTEGVSLFNNIMNIILILQAVLPSFGLIMTSYITLDGRLLYQGRRLYDFHEIDRYVIKKQTVGVNVILGYTKGNRFLYIVLSDENKRSFIKLYEKSNEDFNWENYMGEE